MMIWTILAITALSNVIAVALASAHERVTQATRAALKRERMGGGLISLGLLLSLFNIALATCWTLYAFEVEDWRFAAITWIPIVLGWIVRWTRPNYGDPNKVIR